MPTTIDNRVVSLEFDNAQFERGARETLRSLQGLDDAINYNGMQGNLQAIADRFSTLGIIGMTVTQNLTNSVLNATKAALASVNSVFDQIEQGGKRRAMNIEQAKFQLKGLGIAWEDAYDDINYAVEGTAYGLDAAAKAAAQLSASGVQLGDDMKKGLRGISGVAAMTNSEYEDIARVFITVAGNGRLMASELNRIGARGINAAAALAKYLNVSEAEVRDMTSQGKIDFQTFAAAMDDAFGEHAKDANSTFTGALANIKAALSKIGATFWTPILTEMVDPLNKIRLTINVVKDALLPLGNDGGRYLELIKEISKWSSKLFVDMAAYLEQVHIAEIADGVFNAFDALLSVLKPVSKAFKQVFPAPDVAKVNELISLFVKFTDSLKLSEEQAKKVQTVFGGIFSLFDIGLKVVKSLGKGFFTLLGYLSPVGDGIVDVVVAIANAITTFDEYVGEMDIFGAVLKGIADGIGNAKKQFESIFGKKVDINVAGGIGGALKAVARRINMITVDTNALNQVLDEMGKKLGSTLSGIGQLVTHMGNVIKDIFGGLFDALMKVDANKVMKFLLSGSLVALTQQMVTMFKDIDKVILNFTNITKGIDQFFGVKGTISNIGYAFKELTYAIENIGAAIKANINIQSLQAVAVSILILAGAMSVLAGIDTDKLLPATAAITTLFIDLFGSAGVFTNFVKLEGTTDIAKMLAAFVPLSVAIYICALSLERIGSMNWNDIVKGITGMTAAFVALGGMAAALSKLDTMDYAFSKKGPFGLFRSEEVMGTTSNIMQTAKALVVLAVALDLMTFAIKGLGEMKLGDLVKGIGALYAVLLGLYEFCKKFNAVMDGAEFKKTASGLVLLSVSILLLTQSVKSLGSMDWKSLLKGLGSLAALLTGISLFISKTKKSQNDMIKLSTSLILLAVSVRMLLKVMKEFAAMSLEDIGKGFVGLLAMLIPMTAVMTVLGDMSGAKVRHAMKGVEGLLVMAIALRIVATSLMRLAEYSWEQLGYAVAALMLPLATMTAIITVLSNFSKSKMDHAMIGVKGIIELSAALLIVSFAVSKIANAPVFNVEPAVISLAALLAAMTGVIMILSTFSKREIAAAKLGADGILILSVSLYIVSAAIAKLGELPLESMIPAAIAIGLLLVAMTTVVSVLASMGGAKMGQALLGAAAILVLSISLGKIAKAITVLAKVPFKKAMGAITAFAAVFIALAAAMAVVGSNAVICIAGIAVIMLAIYAMEGAVAIAAVILAGVVATISKFMDTIDKLTKIDPKAVTTNMKALAEGFGYFGETLAILGEHLIKAASARKSMVKIAEAIAILAPAMDTLTKLDADKITDTMVSISLGFQEFSDAITVLGEHFILAKSARKTMITIAEAIDKLAPGVKTMSEIPSDKLASTMGTLADAFVKFGEAIDATPFWAPNNRAKAINLLCDSVDKLANTIPLLMKYSTKKFKNIMVALADGFKGFGDALANTPFWGAEDRGEAIDILVNDVEKLINLFPALESMNTDTLGKNMVGIGEAFKSLGTALRYAPMFNADDRGEGIATLVNSISTLADGVKKFDDIRDSLGETTISTIGDAFHELGASLNAAPLFGSDDRANGVATLVDKISALASGIKTFVTELSGTENLSDITMAIATSFHDLGASLNAAPLFSPADRANAVSILVDKISKLAEGVQMFSDMDLEQAQTIMSSIGQVFTDLGNALYYAPLFGAEKRGNAIASLVDKISTFSEGVHLFTDIDGEALTTITTAIGDAFKSLGTAIKSTPFWNAEGKANALVSVVDSVQSLVASVKILTNVDSTKLTEAITYISSSLTTLGDSLVVFSGKSYDLDAINAAISAVESVIGMLSDLNTIPNMDSLGTSFRTSMEEIGNTNIQAIIDSFMDSDYKVKAATTHIVNSVVSTVNDKKTTLVNSGKSILTYILTGLNDNSARNSINSAIKSMLATMLAVVRSEHENFKQAGSYLVDGFASGISENTFKAEAVSRAMAAAAKNAAKRELDEHSPSREMRKIGRFGGQGFVLGWEDTMDDASDVGHRIAGKTIDAVKTSISKVMDLSSGEGIVIRPHVDLSDVESGAKKIDKMFNGNRSIELANSLSGNSAKGENSSKDDKRVVNNFTFNQTNNSPKALSDKEIYRNTNNQFARFKDAIESV